MRPKKENPAVPAWTDDELDSPFPAAIESAYFDEDLEAWVLSRHADVLEAFRCASLCPSSSKAGKTSSVLGEARRQEMRAETMEALSPARLRAWRDELIVEAGHVVTGLNYELCVDIVEQCARPLCLALSAMVTGVSRGDAEEFYEIAQPLSASSAEPYDQKLRENAKAADEKLQGCFPSEHETLRSSGFVALSHTMQGVLANAWYALLQYPEQWRLLHEQPEMTEQAVEELLRYAGLARIMSRVATEDISLGGENIRQGERIILRIIAANHDPERFSRANELDVVRGGGGHLTLGAGPHSCVAASLIRMAVAAITRPLVSRFAAVTLEQPVEWQGGSGFRYPKSLWVRCKEDI